MTQPFEIYDSLADFSKAIGGHLEQDADFTAHPLEELHSQPIKPPLFRVNYYTVVLICSGRGRYIIDSQTYPTGPNTLYFTNPGHIKGFEVLEPMGGYIFTFTEAFFKQYTREDILEEFPFLIAEVVPPQYLADSEFEQFERLCEQILQEYAGNTADKYKIAGRLMTVLLLKIKALAWADYNPMTEADSGTQIVRAFKQQLEAHYRALSAGEAEALHQVQDYAAAQHLHPSYFSTLIKRKTGKTVNAWIAEKTTAEAQALLARSPQTIQQIAFQLGFKDAPHFSRFFKKQTGQSPSKYRDRTRAS